LDRKGKKGAYRSVILGGGGEKKKENFPLTRDSLGKNGGKRPHFASVAWGGKGGEKKTGEDSTPVHENAAKRCPRNTKSGIAEAASLSGKRGKGKSIVAAHFWLSVKAVGGKKSLFPSITEKKRGKGVDCPISPDCQSNKKEQERRR